MRLARESHRAQRQGFRDALWEQRPQDAPPAAHDLEAGRYRVTAWLRGLDIGKGTWGWTTEFMFDGTDKGGYYQLEKSGTFGWTQLTFVGEIREKRKVQGPSFGLCAPGYLWVDDVTMEKVGDDVALTPKPVLGKEEAPIAPPGRIEPSAVRCPECAYRNMPAWKNCYACGTSLEVKKAVVSGPPVKLITSFEEAKCPFEVGDEKAATSIVEEHATDGKKALKLARGYASMPARQDWTDYDYLKADLYTDAKDPMHITIEVRDAGTTDYYTRVNYTTIVPPGASTLIVPIKQLYVGEKSRPGRMLDRRHGHAFGVRHRRQAPGATVHRQHPPGTRRETPRRSFFDGLWAFDFQPNNTCPVMEGFTPIVPRSVYSEGKGYGLKNAEQPDGRQRPPARPALPGLHLTSRRAASPWTCPTASTASGSTSTARASTGARCSTGRKRAIMANGKIVVSETRDEADWKKQHFRHWNNDDLPSQNTFDKYLKLFDEKIFDVDVTNGQLFIEFGGQGEACDVSRPDGLPARQGGRGREVPQVRRRTGGASTSRSRSSASLHRPTGDPLAADDPGEGRATSPSRANTMKEVYYNDTPFKSELGKPLSADVFAGEYAPLNVAIVPLTDLGKVTVTCRRPGRRRAARSPPPPIDVGLRLVPEPRDDGRSVYTIDPRYIMPTSSGGHAEGHGPPVLADGQDARRRQAGLYKGTVTIKPEKGAPRRCPVELRVRSGTLDDWTSRPGRGATRRPYIDDDLICLKEDPRIWLHLFSSGAIIASGFKDGKPRPRLRRRRQADGDGEGAGLQGRDVLRLDGLRLQRLQQGPGAMRPPGSRTTASSSRRSSATSRSTPRRRAGSRLLRQPVRRAARRRRWCSRRERRGVSQGVPERPAVLHRRHQRRGPTPRTPHFRLAKALHIADLNGHSEASIKILHAAGSDWAFYNGGNRWTFGDYMYKAVKQYNMKFRIYWHWGCTMGDPYYALDGCEDDAAWCKSSPDGQLIPCLDFRAPARGPGRLPPAADARTPGEGEGRHARRRRPRKLIADRMASFKLGQRDHDALFGLATGTPSAPRSATLLRR